MDLLDIELGDPLKTKGFDQLYIVLKDGKIVDIEIPVVGWPLLESIFRSFDPLADGAFDDGFE